VRPPPQDVTLQHYMDYTAESLIPVMSHIAKNVVNVNDGLIKHMVGLNSAKERRHRRSYFKFPWLLK